MSFSSGLWRIIWIHTRSVSRCNERYKIFERWFATLTSQRTSTRVLTRICFHKQILYLRSYNVQVKHLLARKKRRKYVDETFEELSIRNTERLFGQSNEVPDDYLSLGYDSRTANQILIAWIRRYYIFRSHYVYICMNRVVRIVRRFLTQAFRHQFRERPNFSHSRHDYSLWGLNAIALNCTFAISVVARALTNIE